MKAEIIAVGTEILLGEIVDTDSQYIAARLPALGIDLFWVTQAGDNLERVREALERARQRSDVIFTTGGLGPTEDDLTREAIAAVLGEEMRVEPSLEAHLRAFFARRSRPMPERNLKQATLIPSARAIPNSYGTAPGWWVEREGRVIIAMPGPPGEMRRMWEAEVEPELRRRAGGLVLVSRTLKTSDVTEGLVDELLGELKHAANPTVSVYSRADGIQVRIAAKAVDRQAAEALIAPVEAEARRALGDAVWGADDDTLESVVGAKQRRAHRQAGERGLTLATMESCTGGLLASTITDTPGSSDYFKGGLVSYATEMKLAWGVSREVVETYGVISAECAREMARVARERLSADVGIGVTGVAGPDQQEGKPVGTIHIALDDGSGDARVVSYQFAQSREMVKRRAVTTALSLLRRSLLQGRSTAS
ncbi:MAG TPA: competence/damage-inducible protein A [Thermoleophilia bacterium]|nr:competence/damage-inducible protein A [Thermoleophilia bacterium]